MRRDRAVETILVEDSRLVALCWRLESSEIHPLRIFSTPRELLEKMSWTALDPEAVFVIDIDFAGRDVLSGIDLVERLRTMGVRNRIYLYSGFSEIVPPALIELGVVNGVHSKDLSPREVIQRLFPAN